MREFEKMRSGLTYDYRDKEIYASLTHAKKLCAKLSSMSIVDDNYREVIEDLIPNFPKDSTICPPFFCDHGNGIKVVHN
ncbi:MAG: sugar O-acetyltransferase, partial [Prevotella sp.]|nr:sugar O-acetyltransferase [Prevotella sp.]